MTTTSAPVKSNENVTGRQSFSQKIMLPGLSPPFFDFDGLDSAELGSHRGCSDVGNLELAESCPHRQQRKQQVYMVYNGKEESMASAVAGG
jgi:hypothetical protein